MHCMHTLICMKLVKRLITAYHLISDLRGIVNFVNLNTFLLLKIV